MPVFAFSSSSRASLSLGLPALNGASWARFIILTVVPHPGLARAGGDFGSAVAALYLLEDIQLTSGDLSPRRRTNKLSVSSVPSGGPLVPLCVLMLLDRRRPQRFTAAEPAALVDLLAQYTSS